MCFREYFSVGPSFGLPRCDIRITEPPSFKIFLMVGTAASMREVSVIWIILIERDVKINPDERFLPVKIKFFKGLHIIFFLITGDEPHYAKL